jgi:hypothetical protein
MRSRPVKTLLGLSLSGMLLSFGGCVTPPARSSAATVAPRPPAADPDGYQRGPEPTAALINGPRGPFATATAAAPAGNGFGGGTIQYPTDTRSGSSASW